MDDQPPVFVRLLGALHTWRKSRGLATEVTEAVPAGGTPAVEIARALGLPLDKIEAVFCNRVVRSLDHIVRPGDSIAFVPRGTPGPHRYTLGIHGAGRKTSES